MFAVVVVIGIAAATATATRTFDSRKSDLVLLDRRNRLVIADAHLPSSPSSQSGAVTDLCSGRPLVSTVRYSLSTG